MRTAARSGFVRLLLLATITTLATTAAACGGKTLKPVGVSEGADDRKLPPSSQHVIGHMIGSVADRTVGPYLALRADGKAAMIAMVTPAEGTGRRVLAQPLSGTGEPLGAARVIAGTGVDTTMLVVRPIRGAKPAFALAWTTLTDRGEALWSVVVGEDGAPRSKPVELARTADDIVWADIVATDHGAVCFWAEETRGGDANVVAAGLDSDGHVRGVPSRIANNVAGWHATELTAGGGGVGVSIIASPTGVRSSAAKPKGDPAGGSAAPPPAAASGPLTFHRLDADGHAAMPPVTIVAKPVVSGDVEVGRVAGKQVFVWTDRSAEEPAVTIAALGDDQKVEPPVRLVERRGGAALLGLASGPAGTALLFESPARRGGESRRVQIAHLSSDLALEATEPPFEHIGRGTPEITPTRTGFAVLASMRDCEAGSPKCPDAAVLPFILRTDDHGAVVQREPFIFGTDPAGMAWGMSCAGESCLSLAASGASPTRLRAAELKPRANVKSAIAKAGKVMPSDGPRVTDISALLSGENVFDIAATHIGDATVIAMLTAKPEAPGTKTRVEDGRNTALTLSTRTIDAHGVVSPPSVITTRALAVGGVAIAPAATPDDGGAVVWVGRDNGDPEVHVTKIDRKGKKGQDLQLTTVKGDASDVTAVWAGNGWLVAWVDSRDGNGEVYATKVGPDLSRNTGERITNAPGDASDLVAMLRGDLVWLAWADPRESPRDGMADVFIAAVRTKDGKRAVDEQRLLATAAHSRTPQLAPSETGVHVAWIEEAPLGLETPGASGYGAMWATLEGDGKISRRAMRLPLAGEGAASGVTLDGSGGAGSLRAVVARSGSDTIALDALELAPGEPRAFPLLTLDGPPSLDVAMLLDNGLLYFNDDGPAVADKRARRARIAWTR